MASMWNRLLAAMLTAGRKARLLTVGRSSLAMSVPMGWGGEVGAGCWGPQGREKRRTGSAPSSGGPRWQLWFKCPEGGRDVSAHVEKLTGRVQQLTDHVISTCLIFFWDRSELLIQGDHTSQRQQHWIKVPCEHSPRHPATFHPGPSLGHWGAQNEKQQTLLLESRVHRWGKRWGNPRVSRFPWRRKWQPTPVLLPGKSHG